MTPWWTEGQAGWIGGSLGSFFGILGGVFGTVCGICAPRGKCKALVYGISVFMIAAGVAALIAGIVALLLGQPYVVWYPLVLVGIICTAVVGGLTPVIRRRYREAEQRRLEAEELRRS